MCLKNVQLFSLKAWAPPITIWTKTFFYFTSPSFAPPVHGVPHRERLVHKYLYSKLLLLKTCTTLCMHGEPPWGRLFLKNVQRARSCARCASLGETAPAKRLLVVHAKSTTVVVRPTGGRWHYPANHLQPSHLHQHQCRYKVTPKSVFSSYTQFSQIFTVKTLYFFRPANIIFLCILCFWLFFVFVSVVVFVIVFVFVFVLTFVFVFVFVFLFVFVLVFVLVQCLKRTQWGWKYSQIGFKNSFR